MKRGLRQGGGANEAGAAELASWNRVLFDACVRTARNFGARNQFEEALQWCRVAAWCASRKGWFGELSSRQLETELLRAARSLPTPPRHASSRSRPRWLHVLSEAYGTLGHTNLCRRWMQLDAEVTHDVMLLDQKDDVPANLAEAARTARGECVVLDPTASLLHRSKELRDYAWQNADVVVLHTHPEDVAATTAFGVPGGPPVLLVNHADHAFWVGCSVADLVLDIRTSGHLWTKQARGVSRAAVLPLPLVEKREPSGPLPGDQNQKRMLRRELGLPEDAVLFLTVGSAHKYEPVPGLDFVETAKAILEQCQNAILVAVGPADTGFWKAANKATGGRVLAFGRQPDSTVFCRAADVYLEGFPAGSLTALLEAGEAGLPCVRAPGEIAPPYCADDPSMEDVPQPATVKDYIRRAVRLAQDPVGCAEIGRTLQQSIRSHHFEAGWLKRLREIKKLIPQTHSVYPDFKPMPVEQTHRDWFIQYLHSKEATPTEGTVAESAFVQAWRWTAGEPTVDWELWNELRACQIPEGRMAGEGAGTPRPRALEVSRGNLRTRRPRSFSQPTFKERVAFWRLNRRIRRRGTRARLITGAQLALLNGKRGLARRLAYACLLRNPGSPGDLAWIKLFIKSHLSSKWLRDFSRPKRVP